MTETEYYIGEIRTDIRGQKLYYITGKGVTCVCKNV